MEQAFTLERSSSQTSAPCHPTPHFLTTQKEEMANAEQHAAKLMELKGYATKKQLAEFLGMNPSTLGSALKRSGPDINKRLLDVLTASVKGTRAAPSKRLSGLRKTDNGWVAELGGRSVLIQQSKDTRVWTATFGSRSLEAGTFKDIVAELRSEARKL